MSNLTSKGVRALHTVALGLWVVGCGGADDGGLSGFSPEQAASPEPESESGEQLGQLIDASVVSSGSDAGAVAAPVAPTGAGCLTASRDDFEGNGPYGFKTKEVTVGSLGAYTIFYPERLAEGCKHPIVAWGNGTGVTGAQTYQHWQRHAASWGLVVIAAHDPNAGSQRFLEGGIDYLLKENGTAGSEFAGKLSDRAGTAGHSQGGFAATTATRHPNVKAEVNVQGGGTPAPTAAHLCLTGTEDFVRQSCTASYNAAKGPSFLADVQGADHIATPTTRGATTPNGRLYVRLYTAWFRCFLGEDAAACKLFQGGKSAPVCGFGQYATCDGRNIP